MIGGDRNAPTVFSGETNPFMRQAAASKKSGKNKALEVLKQLSGGIGAEDEDGAEINQKLIPEGKLAKMPKYSPQDMYGGFFSMYGGRKVRGGLLGE